MSNPDTAEKATQDKAAKHSTKVHWPLTRVRSCGGSCGCVGTHLRMCTHTYTTIHAHRTDSLPSKQHQPPHARKYYNGQAVSATTQIACTQYVILTGSCRDCRVASQQIVYPSPHKACHDAPAGAEREETSTHSHPTCLALHSSCAL